MNSKMNPARVDREDERRMLPCRNFLDGYCPRGPRCRFYHPLASSIPTVIRVPNLPTSFQQNSFGQFPVHSGGGHHSMYSMSPTATRSHMGMNAKMGGLGTPGSSRLLGMNGFGSNFSRNLAPPLASPTYSEYEMAYAQQMEIQKEKERRASAPPLPESETMQNTVFSHIDWKEFLNPGARPPPPTHVPYMSNSPAKTAETLDSLESLLRSAGGGNTKIPTPEELAQTTFFAKRMAAERELQPVAVNHEDKIPSPPQIREFFSQLQPSRALSAKEELSMKVKEIAKELLADTAESAQPVQSLDTFFRNYTFQSIPTAPSSEQDLVNPGPREMKPAVSSIVQNINEAMEIELKGTDSEAVPIMSKGTFTSIDSGISSGSGDSASSVGSGKEDSEGNKIQEGSSEG